jgi:hypothetical protein
MNLGGLIPCRGRPAVHPTGTGRHRENNGIKNFAGSCSGSLLLMPGLKNHLESKQLKGLKLQANRLKMK